MAKFTIKADLHNFQACQCSNLMPQLIIVATCSRCFNFFENNTKE